MARGTGVEGSVRPTFKDRARSFFLGKEVVRQERLTLAGVNLTQVLAARQSDTDLALATAAVGVLLIPSKEYAVNRNIRIPSGSVQGAYAKWDYAPLDPNNPTAERVPSLILHASEFRPGSDVPTFSESVTLVGYGGGSNSAEISGSGNIELIAQVFSNVVAPRQRVSSPTPDVPSEAVDDEQQGVLTTATAEAGEALRTLSAEGLATGTGETVTQSDMEASAASESEKEGAAATNEGKVTLEKPRPVYRGEPGVPSSGLARQRQELAKEAEVRRLAKKVEDTASPE